MGEIKMVDGILLILALTTDSFVVSFAYGMTKTKMPFFVVVGMNLIMSALLGLAVWAGNFFAVILPENVSGRAGGILLLLLGLCRILSFFFQKDKNFHAVKVLTPKEGVVLAFVLSADSLAVGMGTGLVQSEEGWLLIGTFLGGVGMMKAGWELGSRFRTKTNRDLSWISGFCLLLLAIGTFCRG